MHVGYREENDLKIKPTTF